MEVSWAVGLRREEAYIFGDHSFCPVTKGSQAYPLSKVEKKKKRRRRQQPRLNAWPKVLKNKEKTKQ